MLLDKSYEFCEIPEMSHKKPAPTPPEPKPTPSNEHKLRGDSIEPLVYAWEQEALRLGRRLKFHNRKLCPGPLLSMLVTWYLEQEEGKRYEIARRGCKKYEEMTSPKVRKGQDQGGNPGPSGSEATFGGGRSKGDLSLPIPSQIDGGPKRRADQHGAPAEVAH
jgi:hypothetical protein